MPTLAHIDGFEFQVLSTARHSGAPRLYDVISSTGAAITTSLSNNGAACLSLSPTDTTSCKVERTLTPQTAAVVSFAIRFAGLPVTDTFLSLAYMGTARIEFDGATRRFALRFGDHTKTIFGPATLAANRWYLIDWKVDVSAAIWTQTGQVDGSGSATNTYNNLAASTLTVARLGTNDNTGPAATVYYDDWVYGHTLADYPIGRHQVLLLKPNGDGTHNAGTNTVEDQAGVDIGAAAAWSLINEIPPESSTYVRQVAIGAGNYAEVTFDDPTFSGIIGVEAYQASFSSGTATNAATSRIVASDGSTLANVFSGDMSDSALCYTSKIIPDPGGDGWTAAELSGIKGQVGFATDATPNPRWATLVLQYVALGAHDYRAGLANGTSTAQGGLTLATSLKGAAIIVSPEETEETESGYLDVYTDLYSGAFRSASSGHLSVTEELHGQADGRSSASASFADVSLLLGQADGSSTAQGVLGMLVSLLGQAEGSSTGQGSLGIGRLLIGTADGGSSALGDLGETQGLASFAIWAINDRPNRWDASDRPTHWFTTVFVREDRSVALTFVAYGPFTENEIPEALLIKVMRPLRAGGTTPLELFDQTPAYSATVSIQPPTGLIEHRAAEIMDPADLLTQYPDDFTELEDGWVRVTWEEGDFPADGTYAVQVTLDNGEVRLKSTDVWRPDVNVGPASAVV